MTKIDFNAASTVAGIQYEIDGWLDYTKATSSWTQVTFREKRTGFSMGGLFRFRVGAVPSSPPTWLPVPPINSVYGIGTTFSLAPYVTSSFPPIILSPGSPLPGNILLSGTNIVIDAGLVVGTYNLQIVASDSLSQTASTTVQVISAIGTNPPVWSSTSLISVQQGSTYDLHQICSDPDAGDTITFTSLVTLPSGVSLSQSTGILSVGSGVLVQAYTLRFRATDSTNRVADSQNITLSVLGSGVTPSWIITPNSILFNQGTSQTSVQTVSGQISNWDPSNWVTQLAPTSDDLELGVIMDLNAAFSYNGDQPAATRSNVIIDINPRRQDFATRSSQKGVIRATGFNSAADLAGTFGDAHGTLPNTAAIPTTNITLDTAVKASGTSSMRFTVPANAPNTGPNMAGNWFCRFTDAAAGSDTQFGAGESFYVQWRQRWNNDFLTYPIYNGAGFPQTQGSKQVLISQADQTGCTPGNQTNCLSSCTTLEVCVQGQINGNFPGMYHCCPGHVCGDGTTGIFPFQEPFGASDFKLQNSMPSPFCLYSTQSTGYPGCFHYFPDEWMTFQVHVQMGSHFTNHDRYKNSRIRMWAARESQNSVLLFDWKNNYSFQICDGIGENPGAGTAKKYGKIWFLIYSANDNNKANPPLYTWYDELIISRYPIADPL